MNQQQQQSHVSIYYPLQQQKTWVAVGVGVVGVATSAYGAQQQSKAAKEAAKAGQNGGVDITALDEQARALSKRNVEDSIALEKQYSPETEALRRQATEALLPYTTGNDSGRDALRYSLYQDFNGENNQPLARSSLLNDAVNQAQGNLALGGQLSTSARNEVTRRAGANAASVGGGRVGLGRDISARDLGLSSMNLENQRLQQAGQFGAQDQAFLQAQSDQRDANAERRLSTASLISDLDSQTYAQRLGLAQFGQSLQRPETGLDATSLVNLTTGNQNASNAAAQNSAAIQAQSGNSTMAAGGQLLGLAGGLYANRQQTPKAKTSQTVNYYQ